jgi:hypothetical protein
LLGFVVIVRRKFSSAGRCEFLRYRLLSSLENWIF